MSSSASTAPASSAVPVQGRVGSLDPAADDYLAPDSMQVRELDGERIAVIRHGEDVYAIDNACPHQGYGLVTGTLATDEAGTPLVTCLWHNWKFRATDGVCVMGEENVACHPVAIDSDGAVEVRIDRPSVQEQQATLWPSLQSGLERHYVGQISRDTVRLLNTGATVEQVMAASVVATVERTEDGADHEIALAADCLSIASERSGSDQVLPLVLGLSGLSEQTRGRPVVAAEPVDTGDLVDLIEREDLEGAMGRAATMTIDEARAACIEAASRHHLGYGHGAIYTQKVFEMLGRTGPDLGPVLIPQLVRSLTVMTREDLLPYMRRTATAIAEVDLAALANAPTHVESVSPELVDEFLAAGDPGIESAVELALGGLGVSGLIDLASLGSAQRMLRYDTAIESQPDDNFGWLQITHGLTHARATRWAWQNMPSAAVARMALHGIWLLFDTGRLERRSSAAASVWDSDPAISKDPEGFANRLLDTAMNDQGGSFIVVAHLVKTIRAAAEETEATGSTLPLQATARFINGPRRERFVARNVAEAVRFVDSGRPPRR